MTRKATPLEAKKPASAHHEDDIKTVLREEVDERRQELTDLALKIHACPEVAFQEVKAAGWLSGYLKKNGFSVELGVCGLETAFCASYGQGKPVIAILAEYDALPRLGHACGHNLIAAMAVGAGVAAKRVVDAAGGTIEVIGTPGEELFGGKIIMGERGAFQGVDAAMMVHPDTRDMATTKFLACQNLEVEFFGRASHAAARPEAGINALDAMILSFNGISSLRQHMKSTARIHGIITDGGEAANIVPAHTAGTFVVRAEEERYLDELKEKVINCFVGAACATSARLEYKWSDVCYAPLRNNMTMAKLFQANMQALGRKIFLLDPTRSFGSSDIGNVSLLVPAIHPSVAVAPLGVMIHSYDFARAAAQEMALNAMLDGAKAMALTAADLLIGKETLAQVKAEFEQAKRE